MRPGATSIVISAIALMFISCGGAAFNEGEDYGNLLTEPDGLILNRDKHPDGWGRSECSTCHNLTNVHLVNRTGLDINIAEIHDTAIANGDSGCPDCHGTNGT